MIEKKNIHLQQIVVTGFKSIQQLALKMNSINILIGANGSGKSNFISIFSLLRNLSEGKLQSYVEKQGFANMFFHFGVKTTHKITIDLDFGHIGYYVEFLHGANDSLVFKKEYCTLQNSSIKLPIKGKLGESGLLSDSASDSKNVRKYIREYMQNCCVYHFHDTSPSAGFKQASDLSASDYLYSDASNIASILYRLKEEYQKSYQEIVSAVQAAAPFFHDFYLEPRGQIGDEKLILKWTHRDHDTPFSASQLSDGTARFICMATLFLQPQELKPNTIILDEPELGLHPAALDILADLVKSASNRNQVICSTQSVSFANQFEPDDFIVVDQRKGVSTFRRLDIKELEHWLEEYGMGDIWTKNLVGGRPEW